MTESVIQAESFTIDFSMFYMIVLKINLNTSSMSLSMIIISAFEFK